MLLSADNCSDIPSLSPRLLPETHRSGGRWLHRSVGRVPAARRGRRGSLVNTGGSLGAGEGALGADPPGPESGWLEGSGKPAVPMVRGGSALEGMGAGPSAAPRMGESQARGHLGRRGRALSGAPSQGTTRWLLTARAPGSSWRPGRLASHPCSDPTPGPSPPNTRGLGLQVGLQSSRGSPQPRLHPSLRRSGTRSPLKGPLGCGCLWRSGLPAAATSEVSFRNSGALQSSLHCSPT